MAVNPSNSSEWSADSSWPIKYVGNVNIYKGSSYASSIISDKYDFNLNSQYWDPPIAYENNKYIIASDSMVMKILNNWKHLYYLKLIVVWSFFSSDFLKKIVFPWKWMFLYHVSCCTSSTHYKFCHRTNDTHL